MNKKHVTILLILLLAAVAGCGQKPGTASTSAGVGGSNVTAQGTSASQSPNGSEVPASADTSVPPSATPPVDSGNTEPNAINQEISVYFANVDFTELTASKATIKYSDADSSIGKYKESFVALQNSQDANVVSLWAKVELLSVKFEDGQVTLNIHMPDEARLGSDGELMALDAVQKTLFQFSEVKSIELLVDGVQLDTLMGHVDLMHPMTREK